jgi:hypothetical protein
MEMLKKLLLFAIWVISNIHLVQAQVDNDRVLDVLSRQIAKFQDEKIKSMPKEILRKITECTSPHDFTKLDLECQTWLRNNFSNCGGNLELGETFSKLKEIRGDDDASMILAESLWCRLNGKPFDLAKAVESIGIYWLENESPEIKFAPEGKGKIDWIWKLDVKNRLHGCLHVGIDTMTRRFLCYERTIGVYYPEGETLERIYAEIVQDPIAAGEHIGKGRITNK